MQRSTLPGALFALIALVPLAGSQESATAGSSPVDFPPFVGTPELTRAELEGHVAFLASDELDGRDTGSEEAMRAAAYIAREFEEAGLEPAGDDGTFLQSVPLERVYHTASPRFEARTVDGGTLTGEYGVDFRMRTSANLSDAFALRTVRAREDLPERARPDVALFFDAPRSRAQGWLADAGQRDGDGWGLLLYSSSDRPGRPMDPPGPRLGVPREASKLPAQVTLRGPWLEDFRADQVSQVRVDAFLARESVRAVNVVARLTGGGGDDAELADEVLLLSAHYDHLGSRPGEPGRVPGPGEGPEDTIYNGADDNASGVAVVLELAEALAARGKPARTVLFLLVTGEERGLLGTRHYLDHPAHPIEETLCNLNFEMLGRSDALSGGPGFLWLTGWERTNLGDAFSAAGLSIVADARLDQRFFQRSDNYAFALRGVVAQTLSSYDLHTDYHRVSDEVETLDYAHLEAAARTSFEAVRRIADGSVRPDWLPGGRPE